MAVGISVISACEAGSGHWKCPLYEEGGRGGGEVVVSLKRGMRAGNYRRM